MRITFPPSVVKLLLSSSSNYYQSELTTKYVGLVYKPLARVTNWVGGTGAGRGRVGGWVVGGRGKETGQEGG